MAKTIGQEIAEKLKIASCPLCGGNRARQKAKDRLCQAGMDYGELCRTVLFKKGGFLLSELPPVVDAEIELLAAARAFVAAEQKEKP